MFDIEKNKLYFIVSLFIGVFFVNFHIQQSLHFGVLSLPPTYDDVGYFGDAFKRLRQIYDYGFLGFFKNYIIAPPHSPIYSLLAMIGFSILGYAAWAACASVLIIIVPLIYLYLKNSFNLSLYNKILLIFSILCAPIFSILCIEFRPDAFCGLATASGIFCILFSTNWNNARKSTIFVAGLLFGVSLITKLTVAPVTIMLFFSAMIIVLFIERNCYRQVLHAIFGTSVLAFAIALPFYVLAWAGIYEYIKLAFGVEAPIWTPDLTLFDNLTYYLSGPGGRAGLGAWLGLSIILLILISGIVFYKKNYWLFKRGLGFILIFILAYCIVTFAGIKSPFLGLVVPSLIIISSLYMMSYIINTFNEKKLYTLGNIICLTFAVWAIINWHTEYYSISGFPVVDQSFAAKQREAVKILVSEMKSDAKIGQRMLYEPIIAPYINEDNFFFALLSDGFYCPNANSSWRLTELSEQMKLFEKSDYAIIFSDNAIEPMPWIPSLKIRTQLREMVQSNSNFELISTAKLTADGEVYLYRNKFMK